MAGRKGKDLRHKVLKSGTQKETHKLERVNIAAHVNSTGMMEDGNSTQMRPGPVNVQGNQNKNEGDNHTLE